MGANNSQDTCKNILQDFEHVSSIKVQSLPINFDKLGAILERVGDGSYQIPTALNSIPKGAILAGSDTGFRNIYVGRMWNDGDLLPGKIIGEVQSCIVSQKGKVLEFLAQNQYNFEYLTVDCEVEWKPSANGVIPNNAVPGGQTCNGLRLFVGRAKQHLSVLPGKIIPNDALYIVHAGKEMKFECNYEILVFKD